MIEHLNYCRQMVREFEQVLSESSSISPNNSEDMKLCIELANLSKKFILPENGLLFDDLELRALDESETLNLPFSEIALEFLTHGEVGRKTIIFAREMDEIIEVVRTTWVDGYWIVLNFSRAGGGIRRTEYLNRTSTKNGMPEIKAISNNTGREISIDEPGSDTHIILSFLNALQCSNVNIKESKPRKAAKKPKAALPFDTYHILTVDVGERGNKLSGSVGGTHRSPREHLRRGHIRRLGDGRRVWVNAAVVGTGKGAGVVMKDYIVRV